MANRKIGQAGFNMRDVGYLLISVLPEYGPSVMDIPPE